MPAPTPPIAGITSGPKPWVGYTIDRYGDAAMVTIRWYWFEGDKVCRKQIEQYETLGRGATASARKSIKHIEANLIGHSDYRVAESPKS